MSNAPPMGVAMDEQSAIRMIVADIQDAFNANGPEALVRHIAHDAVIANPLGTAMRGPGEVEQPVRPLFEDGPLRDATTHCQLNDLAALSPDIVVADKSAWATPEHAASGEPPQMTALYVFVKRFGAWWVLRRQNTAIGG